MEARGRGNDTITGGSDNDIIAWSNGDGTDVLDGGLSPNDTVQVNGALAADDVFTIAAGPVAG